MAYTSRKPPPPEIWDDPKMMALFQWMENELDAIAMDSQETNALELRETHAAPTKPREGMIVRADGTDWNPGSGAGLYTYKGGWTKVVEGTQDKYSTITDGTTPASASGADTIKFRANSGLTVATGSNDVTHGDNVLYSLDFSALTAESAIATGDYVVLRDVSAGANVKMLITDVLKILASLTDLAAVPANDDKYFIYDLSATAVKRVDHSFLGMHLIDSGSFSAAATKDWTGLSAYRYLRLNLHSRPATDAVTAGLSFSTDGGSTWTAANFTGGGLLVSTGGSFGGDSDAAAAIDLLHLHRYGNTIGNAAGEGIWASIDMPGFNQTTNKFFSGQEMHRDTAGTELLGMFGSLDDSGVDFDSIRFLYSSGDIAAVGSYELWGIKG